MELRAIIFDLGNTLINQVVDSDRTLDELPLALLPGVKAVLAQLHSRYRLGLLTNTERSDSSSVWLALQKLSIRDYFDAVLTSTDVGRKKPDPALFRCILDRLQIRPENAIMIGNDLTEDIRPAKSIGMSAGYFTTSDSVVNLADFQFSSFLHLPTLLEDLKIGAINNS